VPIGERKIQEDGIESRSGKMAEGLAQARDMDDIELLDAPFRQDVLGQTSIDVTVLDQQNLEHRSPANRSSAFPAHQPAHCLAMQQL
jgi:hypothetical protein